MIRAIRLAAALQLLLLTGCATSSTAVGDLRWDVGLATAPDIGDKVVEVLRTYQYTMERMTGPPSIHLETRWKARVPFEDEAAAGVTAAETRFIIEGRRSPRGDDLYTVRVRAENRGRVAGGENDYRPMRSTPEFRAYANRIVADIRSELATGIRVISSAP